jgi:hypothetical protein
VQQYATRGMAGDHNAELAPQRRPLNSSKASRPAGSAYDRRDLEDWLDQYRALSASERSTPAALADILQRQPQGTTGRPCRCCSSKKSVS